MDYLTSFNLAVVALLSVPNHKSSEKPSFCNVDVGNTECELVEYAFVRDIDPDEGIYLVLPQKFDQSKMDKVNVVHMCDNKIFYLGTNHLLSGDSQQ